MDFSIDRNTSGGRGGAARGENLFSTLRSMTRNEPPERMYPQVEQAVDSTLEYALGLTDPAERSRHLSRLGVALASLAASHEIPEIRLMCLSGLARAEVYGGMQGAELFRTGKVEGELLDQALETVAERHKLCFLDRVMDLAHELSEEFKNQAAESLWKLREGSAEDDMSWLKEMGKYKHGPSFALKEALTNGALGSRCKAAFTNLKDVEEMLACASVARNLGVGDLNDVLAEKLRAAPPEVIVAVLSTLGEMTRATPSLVKSVVSFVTNKDQRVRLAALDGLVALDPPNLGKIFAKIFTCLPSLRMDMTCRLPHLDYNEFKVFANEIKLVRQRQAVFHTLFVLLAKCDFARMGQVLKLVLDNPRKAKPGPGMGEVLQGALTRMNPCKPPAPKPLARKEKSKRAKSSGSTLFGIFGSSKAEDDTCAPTQVCLNDCTVGRGEYKGQSLREPQFTNVVFNGTDFSTTHFKAATFSGCVFNDCQATGAVFEDCSFERSEFSRSDLAASSWHNTNMRHSAFDESFLDGATFAHCAFTITRFDRCTLAVSKILQCAFSTTRFRCVDFSHVLLDFSTFSGTEFMACLFDHARFNCPRFDSVMVLHSLFKDQEIAGVTGMQQAFHYLAWEQTARELAAHESGLEPDEPPEELDAWARRTEAEAVLRWFEVKSYEDKAAAFMANNDRRFVWGMQKLGPEKGAFFRMAPLLLHTDWFDRDIGIYPNAPPCVIEGYVPDYTSLELARRYMPDQPWDLEECEAVPIEAVYTIGSIGTVAQNQASDVDYWVCARLGDIAEHDVMGLKSKLDALSEWADEKFDLEAYFFLMDTEDVRRNNFGFSDQESSGSAQALMLKEEFYRTAVLVAGLKLAWWYVPAGADQKVYDRIYKRLNKLLGPTSAVDMGHMAQIPAEEFFGASLWQIVKGLKSPFKSIMKFGLLERYTAGAGNQQLLCDVMKRAISGRRFDIWDSDPYVVMFREIADHYRAKGEKENSNLVALSFFLKSKLQHAGRGAGCVCTPEEKGVMTLFARTAKQGFDCSASMLSGKLSFSNLMTLGGMVNKFMIKTYLNVREMQSNEIKATINAEDLTKLGRKIFTTFARRENKIERVPFLKMKEGFFNKIFISSEEDKKGRLWSIQGGVWDEVAGRVQLADLNKGYNIVPLLAWVVANQLYGQTTEVKTDLSAAPISAQDLEEFLTALAAFFPEKKTFSTDISENLNPERVTRAFFTLNFTANRDSGEHEQVDVIYSTNWGEMFCRRLPARDETLKVDPAAYLGNHLTEELPSPPKMDFYVPGRAQCQGLLLL